MKASLRHEDRHKHSPSISIIVVLSSQVWEEKLSFLFVAYAYVARVNQALSNENGDGVR